MRKLFVFAFLFFAYQLYAQIGYVETENKVYVFLQRMSVAGLLDNYDSFELPKTRTEVAGYLSELKKKSVKLGGADKRKLQYFLTEFSFELKNDVSEYSSLVNDSFGYLLNDKPKFLFYAADSSVGSVFVNFLGNAKYIYKNNDEINGSAVPYIFGGKIRFTFGKYFGAQVKATNGSYAGDKAALLNEAPFKYNYKFTETVEGNVGEEYFDETAGYFTAQTKYADFKIGRDRLNYGYGAMKTLFGNAAPAFDYLYMNLRYKNFGFTYLHGKLLGQVVAYDFLGVTRRELEDKWIAYHRFTLDISRGTQIGAGETVIYYARSVDFSYLNPFNFYKSAEHANQDRDNSMLFFDFKTTDLLSNWEFYFTWLIDDMDFSKLGTDWYGNNFLWDFGFSAVPNLLQSDLFSFQTVIIDPYFYSHKYYDNNFTNLSFNLADNFQPNSLNISFRYLFSFTENLDVHFSYLYVKHGANEVDENGNLIVNYGGDILQGHRITDSEYVKFLDGITETTNSLKIGVRYEVIRNYDLTCEYVISDYSKEDYSDTRTALYFGLNVIL